MDELSRPGYLHVVLNHLPILGRLFGLGVALLLRSRPARVTAWAVIALAGISAWPTVLTGEQAYRPVRTLSDDAGSDALDEVDFGKQVVPTLEERLLQLIFHAA